MNNSYLEYRSGLIIRRKRKIDAISDEDILNLKPPVSKQTFEPIALNDNVLRAFGFVRQKQKRYGAWYYRRDQILIRLHPFRDTYYCPNIPTTHLFSFLHELQVFYSFFDPIKRSDNVLFMDFVTEYGSRYLNACDL